MHKVTEMKGIACIGWGSLVWDPQKLQHDKEWREDGPDLPIEFARESSDRHITLVICPGLPKVRTLWTLSTLDSLSDAVNDLALREYKDAKPRWIADNVGRWDAKTGGSHGMEEDTIAAWAAEKGLAGVVWTNLPCGFRDARHALPTLEALQAHVATLSEPERLKAEEYVRRAPDQVRTAYRVPLQRALGWG